MKRIVTYLSIISLSVATLFTSCSKAKNASPTSVEDSEKTLSVILKDVPNEGENVWLFSIADGIMETGDMIEAYNDSVLTITPPEESLKYDLVVFMPDDKSWDPSQPFAEGQYCKISVDKNPLASYTTANWTPLERTILIISEEEYSKLVESGKYSQEELKKYKKADLSLAGNMNNVVTASISGISDEYEDGDIVHISASASDANAGYIKSVTFYINDQQVDVQSEAPYYLDWNTIGKTPGKYNVEIVAENNTGVKYSAKDDFLINYKASGKAPQVSFTSHSDGDDVYINTQTTFLISASDDSKITSVTLTAGGNQIGFSAEDKTQYSFDWTPNGVVGKITVTATVKDDSNNTRIVLVNLDLKPAL